MGRKKSERFFMADFETTVYDNQEFTEVWASASVELFTEDVKIYHSINELFDYYFSLNENLVVYFHNLKFDGTFILDYLINTLHLKQAFKNIGMEKAPVYKRVKRKEMKGGTFNYIISSRGQWYEILIKHKNKTISIRDSLKLLPFKLEEVGKAFQTKHRKLSMEYKGLRYAGCTITDDEKAYIANDVLSAKEALEVMFQQGHTQMTIGSNCLKYYKDELGKERWEEWFPDLTLQLLDKTIYGSENVDQYVRKSYKGGWCYLKSGCENIIYHNGLTADVNSLYPSMMHSDSGNYYPVGMPTFWKGDYIPNEAKENHRYYFVRIKTNFDIKLNKLPCIQIKGNWHYRATQWLTTSRFMGENGKLYKKWEGPDGTIHDTRVELTLTMTDYQLVKDHYKLYDFEILDGCWFESRIGIFDDYINYWREIKMKSKGAIKTLAKLFLNNLYGKISSSDDSSFKICYINDKGGISFIDQRENDKKVGYIPAGSAITSYARNFTIRTAQKNYNSFVYADTDSIHCVCTPEELQGVPIHETAFCHWKLESYWDEAIFVRQKTYIEHVTHENGEAIESPYYNVKCAGMPEKCKNYFLEHYEISDFKIGLTVPGKLVPKRIKGGTLLVETTYEMR